MIEWPILSYTIFLPLLGALIILPIKENEESSNNIKWAALWTSLGTFILSCFIWFLFDKSNPNYQFTEKHHWFSDFHFYYHIGVDGISLFMILLSTFLTPFCILASWESIKQRVKEYMIAFLILETLIIGFFSAIDTLYFYIFLEAVLIPMFLIIGIWGGERRIYASFKFFLYTLLGSVLMLIAIIYMYQVSNTMNIEELSNFGVEPIPCFQSRESWSEKFKLGYQKIWSEISEVLTIVTTNKTYMSDNFQNEEDCYLLSKDNDITHL